MLLSLSLSLTFPLFHHREEISTLESKISAAKERYQHTVFTAKDSSKTISALPQFPVNDKFVLNQDEAWYTLSIELQVPIDVILLQVESVYHFLI